MSVSGTNPREDKKKKVLVAIACFVAVLVAAVVLSLETGLWPSKAGAKTAQGGARGPGGPGGAGGPGGQRPPGTGGQITAVSGSAITIQPRGGEAKTFTLTAATKITIDRQPAAAAQLQVGQRARVVSPDSKSATEIHIRTRPPGGRGGPGGPGGPGGRPGGGGGAAAALS